MTDNQQSPGNPADDMAEYLQTFLDETEEQLDDLVETMLALESDSTSSDDLNEAFRLIHSIKGSAGMMGFDSIAMLTHHLENRFERFRSGTERLDEPTMNVVLHCIDFLRQCNNQLRDGKPLESSSKLLDQLRSLQEQAHPSRQDESKSRTDEPPTPREDVADPPPPADHKEQAAGSNLLRMVVRFRSGLQLADLKAQLIVRRLASLGEIHSTQPHAEQLAETDNLEQFEIRIETQEDVVRLRAVADVDGVEAIEFPGATERPTAQPVADESADTTVEDEESPALEPEREPIVEPTRADSPATLTRDSDTEHPRDETSAVSPTEPPARSPAPMDAAIQQSESVTAAGPEKPTTKIAETMRVDIDRLDNLMNLAGELVVNRARFVQISGQISPALRKASTLNRIRDFSDTLRRTIESLENTDEDLGNRATQIQQLRAGLELMNEQFEIWENGRYCFSQIGEAIDQLTRVSHSLQRGVLDTRMVPVGPLFNRFKRVVRDLSKERGKRVNLQIRGEKTELDKRMIDELGDPLVHLVRNSIDHGLEPPDVRLGRGKSEVGTIYLEASHSGNNVYIHVRDDGGGINVAKVRSKLIDNQVLSESVVRDLTDDQALEYIWHPGFSTAEQVTDVSGRGVGMDVVKTRIELLNGTIEIDSTPEWGTTFTLRLPLTLAIINCLLVRLRNVVFSMPIDDVREIVSINERDVVTVQGKHTIDVRDEYIPLVSIDDVFDWHGIEYGFNGATKATSSESSSKTVEAVILHTAGKTMGLQVDELLGSQDIVIKSLSDNFINLRGLSGASILGDGSVCLMLDVGTVIDMATRATRTTATEEVTF